MAVTFQDILLAFDFISSGGSGQNEAFICRKSGALYWRSEDLPDEEELPEDIEDSAKYLPIPSKHDFDLGKPLVLAFAREFLPDDVDHVRSIFSRQGAYARFKDLLRHRGAVDRWHTFEAKAETEALRAWCRESGIELAD
jgi:hypothetical protein